MGVLKLGSGCTAPSLGSERYPPPCRNACRLVDQTDSFHVPLSVFSLQGFLKNERDNALLSAIEESRRRVSNSVPLHSLLSTNKMF